MATLPGTWRYRVSAGTGWGDVSILWLGEMESLICNFCLSVAARKIEQSHPWDTLGCCWDVKQPTNKQTNHCLCLTDPFTCIVSKTFFHQYHFLKVKVQLPVWRLVTNTKCSPIRWSSRLGWRIIIVIIMSVFLERFSTWNMLSCAEQVQIQK